MRRDACTRAPNTSARTRTPPRHSPPRWSVLSSGFRRQATIRWWRRFPPSIRRRARGLQTGLAAQSRGLFGGRKEFAGRRAERLQDPRGVRAGGEGREDRPLEDIRQPVRRGGAEKDQVSSTEVEAVLSL